MFDSALKRTKVSVIDIRYFGRNTFWRSLVHRKKFWRDMTNSFEARILVLS